MVRRVLSSYGARALAVVLLGVGAAEGGWTPQTSPQTTSIRAVQFPLDAVTGFAVGGVGRIYKTTDSGAIWVVIHDDPDDQILKSLHFPVDASIGYAVGHTDGVGNGTIKKTVDGVSWVDQSSGVAVDLRGVYFADNLTGWAVGDGGTILGTTDGGTWLPQGSPVGTNLRSVHFPVDASTGYITGTSGKILKTTNGGGLWVQVIDLGSMVFHSVRFVDNMTGFVVGENGLIYRTTNGGSVWTPMSSGTTELLQWVDFSASATVGYAVGENGTIIKTTDGGSTWFSEVSTTTNDLWGVHFPVDTLTGWAVGLNGTIRKRVKENYRSIGNVADYTTGNVSVTAGSDVVDGIGTSWKGANRGRGDRIDINGDEYTILAVTAEDRLLLTEPATSSFSGPNYTISRQYTGVAAIEDWETCIAGAQSFNASFFCCR